MEQKRLWELTGKKIAGEANQEELDELNRLLEKFPETIYSIGVLDHYWKSSKEKVESEQRETALERHMQRMYEESGKEETANKFATPLFSIFRKKLTRYQVIASIAAILLVVFLLPLLWNAGRPGNAGTMKTLVASKGTKNHFILPDGSKIWLNAGSTIKYHTTFNTDSIREVYLSGEAFFEVRHNDRHPFLIHAGHVDIRDIGTSFNVKAYPLDKTTEATLIEGSIEVLVKDKPGSAILSKPNEKITVFAKHQNENNGAGLQQKPGPSGKKADKQFFLVSTVSPNPSDSLLAETAWMEDVLVFQNESFEELIMRMERWYDISVIFKDPDLKKYRFTGSFVNETVEQAFEELQMIKSFHFTKDGDKIIINK